MLMRRLLSYSGFLSFALNLVFIGTWIIDTNRFYDGDGVSQLSTISFQIANKKADQFPNRLFVLGAGIEPALALGRTGF